MESGKKCLYRRLSTLRACCTFQSHVRFRILPTNCGRNGNGHLNKNPTLEKQPCFDAPVNRLPRLVVVVLITLSIQAPEPSWCTVDLEMSKLWVCRILGSLLRFYQARECTEASGFGSVPKGL